MRSFKRSVRVSSLVLEILADIVGNLVKDPRVRSVVFTRVEVGDDLHLADVYYRVLQGDAPTTAAGLENAKGFIRKELGAQLRIKFTPEIRFFFDDSPEKIERVEQILKNLHRDEDEHKS